MSRADDLRAELRVAELEEALVDAKGNDEATNELKLELRYARWVHRGGPAEEAARLADEEVGTHTNRHVAELYERWQAENGEG